MQIEVKHLPPRMIGDSTPRKAPSPPRETAPSLSMRSTMSQDTLQQSEKEALKEKLESYHVDLPREPEKASFEVDALRSKVELLELKLEEMTQKVHVRISIGLQLISKMLQWHSDPQRQAALEDWALQRMVTIYSQYFPQPKATIGELVRLFEVSKSVTHAKSKADKLDKRVV